MVKLQARWVLILLVLASLLGMGLVFYATTMGPGVGGDATIYLTTARGLLQGRGLGWIEADGSYRLLPYTPPFYPLVLSGMGLLVTDMVAGARWLNILFFGIAVFLLGASFYRYTRSAWFALLLSGSLAASPVLVGVSVWAMSEPLFLLLGFAGLLAVLDFLHRPRSISLVLAALLCGLSFLTRYFGVAFVVTGGLALLSMGSGSDRRLFRLDLRWKTIRSGLVFGVLSVIPILIWLAIDFSTTGTVGSRSGQPAAAYLQRFMEIFPALEKIYLFWLIPDSLIARLPDAARAALWVVPLLALTALIVLLLRRPVVVQPAEGAALESDLLAARLAWLFGLFILVYLIALVFVQVLTFPPITLASRMLSPVHAAALVLVFSLVHLALRRLAPRSHLVLALAGLGCLALMGSYMLRGGLVARDYHWGGIGYMSKEWQESETLAALRELDPEIPIITNETTAVMFFLDRPAYALQEIYQSEPLEVFTAYGQGDDPGQNVFRQKGGALVLFNNTLYDDFAMYGDRAEERIQALVRGLVVYYRSDDGGIYFYPRTSEAGDECID